MLNAFDTWINQPTQGRVPAYWAMLAFEAGWIARDKVESE